MIMFWVPLQAVSRLLCVLLGGLDLGDRNLIEGRPRALHPPPELARLQKPHRYRAMYALIPPAWHFGRRPTEWFRRPIKWIWPESSRLLSPDFANVSVGR